MSANLSPPARVPMTTVHVPVSEAAWQQLRQRAAERGVAPEELARTVLEREAAAPKPEQSAEQWVAEWRAWVASHPRRELTVDDSRDSIYEGS
jgi:hypothetical protein